MQPRSFRGVVVFYLVFCTGDVYKSIFLVILAKRKSFNCIFNIKSFVLEGVCQPKLNQNIFIL